MSVRSRARGLLIGAAAAEVRLRALESGIVKPGPGTVGDDDRWMPAATRMVWASGRSILFCGGVDGRDQAHRFVSEVVAAPSGGFSVLERLVAGMIHDGEGWREAPRVLTRSPGGQTHDGVVRGLPAAIVAAGDDAYRSRLAQQLVSVTHASDTSTAAAMLVVDAAAAWIRGEGGVRQAGHEPLRARSLRDVGDDWSACGLDVVRSTVAVAGSTPSIIEAVEDVRGRWWGDARAVVLAGALAGARHGDEAIPSAWCHPIVDRKGLVRLSEQLHQRGLDGAGSPLLAGTV